MEFIKNVCLGLYMKVYCFLIVMNLLALVHLLAYFSSVYTISRKHCFQHTCPRCLISCRSLEIRQLSPSYMSRILTTTDTTDVKTRGQRGPQRFPALPNTYNLMDDYFHSLSVDTTIMVMVLCLTSLHVTSYHHDDSNNMHWPNKNS